MESFGAWHDEIKNPFDVAWFYEKLELHPVCVCFSHFVANDTYWQ